MGSTCRSGGIGFYWSRFSRASHKSMALCSLSCTVNLGDERGSRNLVSDISVVLQATEKGLWCKEKDCFREPWKIDGQVFLPLPM
jgi:hypothetical protein